MNEVQSLGVAGGTTATPDEALTGRFWNGAIQNYWNEIAQTASLDRHLTMAQNARLFALLNLSFADSVIAFYDAKYTYNRWRPVTAIRAAGTDDNPDTTPDANWLPEVGNTTPDPAYPGAHAVISAAAAEVLLAVLHARSSARHRDLRSPPWRRALVRELLGGCGGSHPEPNLRGRALP